MVKVLKHAFTMGALDAVFLKYHHDVTAAQPLTSEQLVTHLTPLAILSLVCQRSTDVVVTVTTGALLKCCTTEAAQVVDNDNAIHADARPTLASTSVFTKSASQLVIMCHNMALWLLQVCRRAVWMQ